MTPIPPEARIEAWIVATTVIVCFVYVVASVLMDMAWQVAP